ncbi:MAG TPA: Flp pilus assembly protein CpaB [Kofleriaceae bacterium]|nr:Flp pilus assembly protein CpaB [Kofleriaceae bacterium]
MNRKALLAALFMALAGVALLLLYKERLEAEASGGEPVGVLMAVEDIPLGAVLTDQMLGVRQIPGSYVEFRHIRASDAARVIGVRVSMEVKANESILWTDLATTSGERRDLSSLVKSGMRAITIRADATSAFGGLLRPGDRVDAFLTVAREGDANGRVTIPLLQNVIVLAVGQDTGALEEEPSRKAGPVNQVTLGVTVAQAQVVAFSTDRGRLSLVLRNPDDIAMLDGIPDTTVEKILDAERHARPGAAPPPASPSGASSPGAEDKNDR